MLPYGICTSPSNGWLPRYSLQWQLEFSVYFLNVCYKEMVVEIIISWISLLELCCIYKTWWEGEYWGFWKLVNKTNELYFLLKYLQCTTKITECDWLIFFTAPVQEFMFSAFLSKKKYYHKARITLLLDIRLSVTDICLNSCIAWHTFFGPVEVASLQSLTLSNL